MKITNNCICCHSRLLKHLNHYRVYWFCPHCYQKMPNINRLVSTFSHKATAPIKQSNSNLHLDVK